MSVDLLEHINVRCHDADTVRDFYVDVLGLRAGWRPPFNFHGHWLYAGEQAVVHLVQKRPDEGDYSRETTAMNHIAFRGRDAGLMREKLVARGIPFREGFVPRDNTVQLFFKDPEGTPLELNFPPRD